MSGSAPERRDASLAGHTVLRAHDVVRNFPLRIAAADAWGDALVVGTADGSLLVFAQAEPSAPPPRGDPPADAEPPRYEVRPLRSWALESPLHRPGFLLSALQTRTTLRGAGFAACFAQVSLSIKRFAPKGVAQLAVLEEEALLLVLSDGTLSAYALPSLEPATAAGAAGLARARGVTCVPVAHALPLIAPVMRSR
jgi:hypothetical protein